MFFFFCTYVRTCARAHPSTIVCSMPYTIQVGRRKGLTAADGRIFLVCVPPLSLYAHAQVPGMNYASAAPAAAAAVVYSRASLIRVLSRRVACLSSSSYSSIIRYDMPGIYERLFTYEYTAALSITAVSTVSQGYLCVQRERVNTAPEFEVQYARRLLAVSVSYLV